MSTILFDFFGTLVSYSPSRIDQGYPRCHEFLREHGSALSYRDFLTEIDACFTDHDRRSDIPDDRRIDSVFDLARWGWSGRVGPAITG
jgi:putative hydrolase of the HAD superfamily